MARIAILACVLTALGACGTAATPTVSGEVAGGSFASEGDGAVQATTYPEATDTGPGEATPPSPCRPAPGLDADADGDAVVDRLWVEYRTDRWPLLQLCLASGTGHELAARVEGIVRTLAVDLDGDGDDEILVREEPIDRGRPDAASEGALTIYWFDDGRLDKATLLETRFLCLGEVDDSFDPAVDPPIGDCRAPADSAAWTTFLPTGDACVDEDIAFDPVPGSDRRWYVRHRGWPRVGLCQGDVLLDEVAVGAEGTVRYQTDANLDGVGEVWVGSTTVSSGGSGAWTEVDDRIVPILIDGHQLSTWSGYKTYDADGPLVGVRGCMEAAVAQVNVRWSASDTRARWERTLYEIDGADAALRLEESGQVWLDADSPEDRETAAMELATSLAGSC